MKSSAKFVFFYTAAFVWKRVLSLEITQMTDILIKKGMQQVIFKIIVEMQGWLTCLKKLFHRRLRSQMS